VEEERAHVQTGTWAPSENVGAPTFKVLLEGYLLITDFSNGFADVLKGKRLAFGIRMGVFPK